MTFLSIDPSEIRYIHDTIHTRFRGGPSVGETLRDLKTGFMNIEELPPIRIVRCDNKLYSLDNRRLYVLKNLHECGYIRKTDVMLVNEEIPKRKFTTENDGRSVEFAEDNDEYNMICVIRQWQCEDNQEEYSPCFRDALPYICHVCDKDFASEDSLEQHQTAMNHCFPCDVCDKLFASEHSREQHQTAKNHFQYRTSSNREQRDQYENENF